MIVGGGEGGKVIMFGVLVIGIPPVGIPTLVILPNGPFVIGRVPYPTSSIVSPIIPGVVGRPPPDVSGMISVITT